MFGKFFGQIVAVLVGLGLVWAFFSIPEHQSVDGTKNFFERKVQSIELWVDEQAKNNFGFDKILDSLRNGGSDSKDSKNSGSDRTTVSTSTDKASEALAKIEIKEKQKVDYNRDEWDHWASKAGKNGKSCWTVREEVLYRQAETGTAILKDKNGKETTDYSKACEITGGAWKDPYSGATIKKPKELDIDHMIPLKYAAQTGGQSWSQTKKGHYANDEDGTHLIAVKASENRSKADKGPSAWKPTNKAYHCDYAKSWIEVANKYELALPKADVKELQSMLKTCK